MNMIEKIEHMMAERNLSKADVSKKAQIPYTTFDGIFKKGYENMKLPTLQKLANFFNVSMEYLINDNIEDENWGKVNYTDKAPNKKQIDTIAAHLEDKKLTPQKIKLLEKYIDALFEDDED